MKLEFQCIETNGFSNDPSPRAIPHAVTPSYSTKFKILAEGVLYVI